MPRIWLSYAWDDDAEGDFLYLVGELQDVGVEATYDKIAIIPGRDLWQQIGEQITEGTIDGWGYVVTPQSLKSEACREELAYALSRALSTKGRDFPLIGLLHGVPVREVPPALRIRWCVSLADPDWKDQVRAGLEGRPPELSIKPQTQYVWTVHEEYQGNPDLYAIEVRPRFGEVSNWRFVIPRGVSPLRWGHGPAGRGAILQVQTQVVRDGKGKANGEEITWFGAGDRLSPGSAYVVFAESIPRFVGFGLASEPFGQPGAVEVFRTT